MKILTNKIRLLLISCLAIVAIALGALSFIANDKVAVEAAGVKLNSDQYSTDGSSMRIFKSASDVEATDKTGLRFHVEMGNGYSYNGDPILNLSETNDNNGSFKINEGFTTYTLIIPTRLLEGELSVDTPMVMKLNTSNFWYFDSDGNLESVAYVYNIPDHRYTDMFSFRGVVCDSNGTEIASTPVTERCVVEIAKKSYDATVAGTEDWGNEDRNNVAINVLKSFIPTYEVKYQNADGTTLGSESVMWGNKPTSAPTGDFNSWYDTNLSEEVDISKAMVYSKSGEITLVATKATEFTLTGVADINSVEFNGESYSGAKVFATLPKGTFPYDEEFDLHAVKVEYVGNGTFEGLQKVFVLNEGSYDRIVFAFDSSNMISGDQIIIKGDSVFYIGGKMYKLNKDYAIDYTRDSEGNEDYGIFLGYIYNSDIKEILNYTEDRDKDSSNGNEYKTIRVTFYEDVFVNSNFTFENTALPEGYEFPVFVKCPQDGINKQITGGYYYWNDGVNQILELNGFGNHNQDELYGAPGTKLVQNGGYYIFEDEMYAYYLGDGDGINEGNDEIWVVGSEIGKFNTASFEIIGTHASDTVEIRLTTKDNTIDDTTYSGRWWNDGHQLTVENMSSTEPYAIYFTSASGVITPITQFRYHGQDYISGTGETAHHQIFGLSGVKGTEAGDTITIIAGTRLWKGQEYWTATEDIIMYYNNNIWIVGSDGTADSYVGVDDCSNKNFNLVESDGIYKVRLTFTDEQFNGKFGPLQIESGSVKLNNTKYTALHYHGGGNRIFEIKGDTSGPLGKNAFFDTITIEQGTRLWLEDYCLEFSEEIHLIFIGEISDSSSNGMGIINWVPANRNTNITNKDIIGMLDATDAGGEVRFNLKDGLIANDYYGFMAMDTSKGIPVVNGIEMQNKAFCYGQGHDLMAVRGGEYGEKAPGSSIYIPAGSVWYTSQGSFTFTEDIVRVHSGGEWLYDCYPTTLHETITNDHVERLYIETNKDGSGNPTSIELRMQVSKDLEGFNYYGPTAIIGNIYHNDECIPYSYGYWYGGGSGTYTNNNSLIGFRAPSISALGSIAEGDVITIEKGTKIVFRTASGLEGYNVIGEDLTYTYANGTWLEGDQTTTVTYTASNATVNVPQKVIIGTNYSFSVEPNSGYTVSSITVNGNAITLNANNTYTVPAESNNNIVVETVKGFSVTFSVADGATVDGGAIENGTIKAIANGNSLTFAVSANSGYVISGVSNAINNGDGTYTVTPNADITVAITTKHTYSVTFNIEDGALVENGEIVNGTVKSVTEGESITFSVSAESGYEIKAVTGVTTDNGNGTYTVTPTANTTVSVTIFKNYNVTYVLNNATATFEGNTVNNGATISVKEGSYTVTVKANDGYILKDVTGAIDNGDGTYTINVTEDMTVTANVIDPINVTNATIINTQVFTTDTNSIRIYFDKENAEISALSGENYNVTFVGTCEPTLAGTRIEPTQYNYFGLLGDIQHAAFEVVYDITQLANGDTLVIEKGAYFYWGDTYIYFDETYSVTFYQVKITTSNATVTGVENGWYTKGTVINPSVKYNKSDDQSFTINNEPHTSGDPYTINGPTDISASSSCLVEGTMVMMADGSMKAVENIVAGDKVIVFNHETGKYEAGTIWFNDHANDPARLRNVINLEFANGAIARIAYEHAYFDLDLMQYVFISEDNMHEFIGHRFVTTTFNGTEVVQGETTLVNAYITEEVVKVYGPISEYHFNLVTDEMLSMPSFNFGATGMVNIFEYDADLKYNAEMMQADIETYGVFTYEEFSEYMSYEDYCKAPIAYFKVAIGKGNLTWEQIEMTLIYLAENEF